MRNETSWDKLFTSDDLLFLEKTLSKISSPVIPWKNDYEQVLYHPSELNYFVPPESHETTIGIIMTPHGDIELCDYGYSMSVGWVLPENTPDTLDFLEDIAWSTLPEVFRLQSRSMYNLIHRTHISLQGEDINTSFPSDTIKSGTYIKLRNDPSLQEDYPQKLFNVYPDGESMSYSIQIERLTDDIDHRWTYAKIETDKETLRAHTDERFVSCIMKHHHGLRNYVQEEELAGSILDNIKTMLK